MVVISSGTLSGSFTSPWLEIFHSYGYSVTAVISGSLTGSVQLLCSNDPGIDEIAFQTPVMQTFGSGAVTIDQRIANYDTVASQDLSCSTLSGPSKVTFNASQQFYKWLAVGWSQNTSVVGATSNTGSIDIFWTAKGNRQ